jgi:hypothetical protein
MTHVRGWTVRFTIPVGFATGAVADMDLGVEQIINKAVLPTLELQIRTSNF